MARIEVVMPQMGESIAEGTIVKWHKRIGESVKKDETLLEISTDKVDSEIPSPAAGVLVEIVAKENETVPVHAVIAYLESNGASPAPPPEEPQKQKAAPQIPVEAKSPSPAPATTKPSEAKGSRFYSPLVMTIARAENVSMTELEQIPGTGEGGRVSKNDILSWIQAKKTGRVAPQPVPSQQPPTSPLDQLRPADDAELRKKYPSPEFDVLQMSNVMHRMAEHMVESVHTSPHVYAVHEVDMSGVVRHREQHAEEFLRREGFKLTYTPYVVAAVVGALKKFPIVNSSVEGGKIIRKNFINIGIAVASESGLLVPVIKHAEEKNFLGLARAVNDLAQRTRAKKLQPEEVQGGTFSITNYGVFGTLIGTPLINQPQVAILGTGVITKRVAVVDDMLAIRSMAFFTVSFDHRIIDGATGGKFLAEIVDTLEHFDAETGIGL